MSNNGYLACFTGRSETHVVFRMRTSGKYFHTLAENVIKGDQKWTLRENAELFEIAEQDAQDESQYRYHASSYDIHVPVEL